MPTLKASNKLRAEYVLQFSYNYFMVEKLCCIYFDAQKANDLKIWTDWPTAHKNWIKDNTLDLTPARFKSKLIMKCFTPFLSPMVCTETIRQ